MQFTNFDVETFLRDYWQKKPLLIRNPWESWHNPLEPDELAGLACEETVESRLITLPHETARKNQPHDTSENWPEDGPGNWPENSPENWEVGHGPFPETQFSELDKKSWTLLVQAVDHHVPEVAALIAPFRFIPNWRIDDVMVSYATDGGGVGAHFDHYDVFLVQGLGKRRWQTGQFCDETTPLLPHDNLRLLANFELTAEWVLEPGDILYVPPGVAHNGVAIGDDCMTYSIGFRAPSRNELIGNWADDFLAGLNDDDRYGDADLPSQSNPGEISAAALDRLHAMISEKLSDRDAFSRWFGTYNTTRKYADMEWQPEQPASTETLRQYLATGYPLLRNPASRFSFVRQNAETLLLFVDGICFSCGKKTASFAQQLCAYGTIDITPQLIKSDAVMDLVTQLFNQGSVGFDTEN